MRKRTGKTFLFCGMGAVIVSLMFLFDGGGVFSHSGRTDSSGGHYNRKTGGYHYHGTPSPLRRLILLAQPQVVGRKVVQSRVAGCRAVKSQN